MMENVTERLHQNQLYGQAVAGCKASNLRQIAALPNQIYPRQLDAAAHPVTDIAQQQIDIAAVALNAVDEKTKLREHLADPAPDIGEVHVLGGEIGKQCRKACANAVVHVGRDLPPLGKRRIDDIELRLLA